MLEDNVLIITTESGFSFRVAIGEDGDNQSSGPLRKEGFEAI